MKRTSDDEYKKSPVFDIIYSNGIKQNPVIISGEINMNKRIWIFFLILGMCSLFLPAQEGRGQARLKGTVVDEDGNPVAGATVELSSLIHDLTMTAQTDEDGEWSFIGLGKTVVKITARKEGYDPTVIQRLQVSAFSRRNPDLEIVLKKTASLEELETVSPKALYMKGERLYEEGEYEKALAAFQEFLEKQPDLYEARINIGNIYIKLNQPDKAIEQFNIVLDKLKQEKEDLQGDETAAAVYASLGELHMDKNDFEQAQEYFAKSIEINPSNHALAYNVGEILFNSQRIDEAIEYYQLAAEINPDWPKSYLKLGYCYLNKGENEKAIENLEKFIQLSPEDDPMADSVRSIIENLKQR